MATAMTSLMAIFLSSCAPLVMAKMVQPNTTTTDATSNFRIPGLRYQSNLKQEVERDWPAYGTRCPCEMRQPPTSISRKVANSTFVGSAHVEEREKRLLTIRPCCRRVE